MTTTIKTQIPPALKLTEARKIELRAEVVKMEDTKPVRFLHKGQAVDIVTGRLASKGSNVMYHPVFWVFSKASVEKICQWLDVRAVWSE